MAGLITQRFIDDLLDRVDIVDVVDSRVKLKKTGKNYSACCPFHDEKTPSFTVAPDKQFYHCFGCGASGNAIGFVMDYDRVEFPEAVERLASTLGLTVEREQAEDGAPAPARNRLQPLFDLMAQADRYYRTQLRQHPEAPRAVDYLKGRGLSGTIARNYGIGFAPPGWDNLLTTLGGDDQQRQQLLATGMLVERESDQRLWDRFRDRIMFPIRDLRGRVIGFGGRVLGDGTPKYLNSPETPLFQKGRELYGLYEARQALRELPQILIVEGYMDVVALAQMGIHNACATLGTATTSEHLEKLFRFTQDVVFCFDGDNAGRQAARRALENCLPALTGNRQARFLFLPEGEDPDTLVRREGAAEFQARVDSALPLSSFLFQSLGEHLDLTTPDGRARLAALAAPLLDKVPEGFYRLTLEQELARRTQLDDATLKAALAAGRTAAEATPPPPQHTPDQTSKRSEDSPSPVVRSFPQRLQAVRLPPARMITALLLHHPELAQDVGHTDWLAELEDPDLDLFRELLDYIRRHPGTSLAKILGAWQALYEPAWAQQLAQLAANELLLPTTGVERQFHDALAHLRQRAQRQHRDRELHQLLEKVQTSGLGALSEAERDRYKTLIAQKNQSVS